MPPAGKGVIKVGRRSLLLAAVAVALVPFLFVMIGKANFGSSLLRGADVALGGEMAGNSALPTVRSAVGDDDAGGASDGEVPPEMRHQLADIARAYADNARYPSYATPLSGNDWAQLNPRAFVPRSAPLKALPGVSAAIVLDRYIVDRDQDLPLRVVVSTSGATGMPDIKTVRVQLRREEQSSAPVALARVNASAFAGVVPGSVLRAVSAGEIVIVADIDSAGGERASVTAMVNAYDNAARLLGLGEARIEGADLVIPARFDVATPGFYRVQANLFTASGNVPVSHLSAEFPLAAGPVTAEMKVHAVTLRAAGEAGPYVLRDIDITRLPDQPGQSTGYGSAAADIFAVRGFPLDAYSNEPWEDPEARQRTEFLRKLGQTQ